jgi:EAL domain-containing protein (putative c-di-GMP-specific phosphodiesterase class I)
LVDGRLRVMAQPIVDTYTDEVVSQELMPLIVRGDSRAGGAADVDAWLVERAARTAAIGHRTHVAVRAGAIHEPRFPAWVEHAIEHASVDPGRLTIVVDEAVAIEDTDAAARFARALVGFGARVAIGGVALRSPRIDHLDRIPSAAFKIDARLVRQAYGADDLVIRLARIVRIGRALGRHTIADGVEDGLGFALMSALGVDYVQGFHRQRN